MSGADVEFRSSSEKETSTSPRLWNTNTVTLLEANLDDMTPEALAYAMEVLLKKGALDAWISPIVMKKGRSAHCLHCLCRSDEDATDQLLETIFRQTTTLGVRIQRNFERAVLRRSFHTIQTPYLDNDRHGKVDVKIGYLGDEVVSMKAEFDHCKSIAEGSKVGLQEVSNAAIREVQSILDASNRTSLKDAPKATQDNNK